MVEIDLLALVIAAVYGGIHLRQNQRLPSAGGRLYGERLGGVCGLHAFEMWVHGQCQGWNGGIDNMVR